MKRKTKWLLGTLAASAAALLLEALFLEKYFFEVKVFDIGPGGSGRRLKLVLLTDLHFKRFLLPYHHKLAATVNRLQPDLLLITGDTLDSSGSLRPVEKFLGLLHPGTRKAAVPGNNDYKARASLGALALVYARHSVDLLVNASKAYTLRGTRLVVTGLDDLLEGESDFEAAVKGTGGEEHHLLLAHSPLQQETAIREMERINRGREVASRLNIRYIFAGHNHGGQVRLPGYVPVLPPKSGGYVNGWYNQSAPFLYVSKGFGTSSLPFRFGARSEVTLFRYHA